LVIRKKKDQEDGKTTLMGLEKGILSTERAWGGSEEYDQKLLPWARGVPGGARSTSVSTELL